MKRFYIWLCREVPEGLEPAKGSMNGIILGFMSWVLIIFLFYAGYLMLGGK